MDHKCVDYMVLKFCCVKLYPGDRSHRMPIITPAYPAMCATHNVTESTQMIMTEEFKRGMQNVFGCPPSNSLLGADIVDKIICGTAKWSELYAKHDFFHKYRYYLQVIASTGNADLQTKWYVHRLYIVWRASSTSLTGRERWSQGYGNWS